MKTATLISDKPGSTSRFRHPASLQTIRPRQHPGHGGRRLGALLYPLANSSPNLKIIGQEQRGLTLVELLIAMVIGLIIIAGVFQLFQSNLQAQRMKEDLSRIQESGRFALALLSRDAQQAGFKGGCARGVAVNSLLDPGYTGFSSPTLFDLGGGIQGWDGADPGPPSPYGAHLQDYAANTDVLSIRHAAITSGARASGNTPPHAATIDLTGPSGIPQGAVVLVSQAASCDLFQSNASPNANNLNRAGPGNRPPGGNPLSQRYTPEMQIMLLQSVIYYIGQSGADPANRSLWRVSFAQGTNNPVREELVEGVIDMQIRYGVDNNADRNVDEYLAAAGVADWDRVLAVRINLLLRGNNQEIMLEPVSIAFDGGIFNAAGQAAHLRRHMYQVFATTIGLRNHLR